MGKLVYGYWDCPQCKTKGIRGDNRECPCCGRPRSSETKFYMGDNIEYVPTENINKHSREPDWLCSYCNSLNSARLTECQGCGSSRIDSEKNYFDLHKCTKTENILNKESDQTEVVDDENCFESITNIDFQKPSKVDNSTYTKIKSIFRNLDISKIVRCLIVVMSVIFAVILGIILLTTHVEKMTVTGFEWRRTIEIEKLVTEHESDWNLPTDARLTRTTEEIRSYEQVFDHYETKTRQVAKQRIVRYEEYVSGYRDLGNGMFEEITNSRPIYETYYETETYQDPVYRQEPVYDTKYYYDIDRWHHSRDITTSGTDKSPVWGSYILTTKERVKCQNETYTITLIDKKNKLHNSSTSFDIWNRVNINDTVNAKINVFGVVVSVDWTET